MEVGKSLRLDEFGTGGKIQHYHRFLWLETCLLELFGIKGAGKWSKIRQWRKLFSGF